MSLLEVGRIVRSHGLRGQVVVELWTNRTERVEPGSVLDASGRWLKVHECSPQAASGGKLRFIVSFHGVDTREDADALRDQVLCAEPVEVKGALWVHEMVGATLFSVDGSEVGVVEAVQANPASDLLVLADGRLVPLTFVTARDGGGLVVDGPPGLLDPL